MNKEKKLIFDSGEQSFRLVDADAPGQSISFDRMEAHAEGRAKKTMAEMHRTDIEHFRHQAKMPVTVVLDNVRSLNNIGSIFRTCDGFACRSIALCGITAVPPSPQIHKTALGAEDSMDWQYFATTAEAVRALQADGVKVLCLEQVHGSVPLQHFVPARGQAYALVVGNEVEGVDPAVVDMCDGYIEIPQSGTKHSFNVAVATAITLWEFYRYSDVIGEV